MKKVIFYIIVGLLIVPLESFVFGRFNFAKPDIALLVVYFAGLYFGEYEGIIVGGFLGIILDVFYGGILGINFFSKIMVGYISGSIGSNFQNINYLFNLISIFSLSILDLFVSFFMLYLFYDNVDLNHSLSTTIFPTAFNTTILGSAIIFGLSEISNKTRAVQ